MSPISEGTQEIYYLSDKTSFNIAFDDNKKLTFFNYHYYDKNNKNKNTLSASPDDENRRWDVSISKEDNEIESYVESYRIGTTYNHFIHKGDQKIPKEQVEHEFRVGFEALARDAGVEPKDVIRGLAALGKQKNQPK